MTNLTDEQRAIRDEAEEYARKNKKRIARSLTSKDEFPPEVDVQPITLFMAGAPGAGKTEMSMALLKEVEEQGGHPILRIDPDDLRCKFEKYDGENSWLFQKAVTILVEKMVDFAISNGQSFILDGTFSNLEKACDNINRCLGRGRLVWVMYVYQDPLKSWRFAKAREDVEGRKVPLDTFVSGYFDSRHSVNEIIKRFENKVEVMLVGGDSNIVEVVTGSIDTFIPETYDRLKLREAICLNSEQKGD